MVNVMTRLKEINSIKLIHHLGYVGVPSPGVSIRLAEFTPSPQGSKANYKVTFETSHEDLLQEIPKDKVSRVIYRFIYNSEVSMKID